MRTLTLLLLVACSGGAPEAPQKPRVDAVAVAKVDPQKIAGFCERHDDAASAKSFAWPAMDTPAPTSTGSWRWVNVWATWCGPCVAEMPSLLKWKDKLASQGMKVDLSFVSVDDRPELVTAWKAKHPDLGVGDLRATNTASTSAWLTQSGLDAGAAIPLHFFVDPENKVRCVRSGAIDPGDFEVVKAVLSGQ